MLFAYVRYAAVLLIALAAIAAAASQLSAAPQPAATFAGARLVKDIDPTNFSTTPGSFPQSFVTIGDTVFFTARNESNGYEVWKKTGNAPATLIRDIYPGDGSVRSKLAVFDGAAYVVATAREIGTRALYRIGDDASGVQRMFSSPGPIGTLYGGPDGLYFFEGPLPSDSANGFSRTVTKLWRTAGQAGSATLLATFDTPIVDRMPRWYGSVGATSFFLAPLYDAPRLYKTDGTAAGTSELFARNVFDPGIVQNDTTFRTIIDGHLYFIASSDTSQSAIYRTDGTTTEVFYDSYPVRQLAPAADSLAILTETTLVNGQNTRFVIRKALGGDAPVTLHTCPAPVICETIGAASRTIYFFEQPDSTSAWALYRSSGTPEVGQKVQDLVNDPANPALNVAPTQLIALGDAIYFAASGSLASYTSTLWRSDGTASGTKPIKVGLLALGLTRAGDRLFFGGDDNTVGRQPWESDGTTAGTKPLALINPTGGNPSELTVVKQTLFFVSKNDNAQTSGLWKSDGTRGGTVRLTNPADATAIDPRNLTATDNLVFFIAGPTTNQRLWRSDGTLAGTRQVPCPQSGCTYPLQLVPFGTRVVYRTFTTNGDQLWTSDGSSETKLLDATANSTTGLSNGAIINGILYLIANTTLVRTDGTPAGTKQIMALGAANGSNANSLYVVGQQLYFLNDDAAHGTELWTSDRTAAGTRMVQDLTPGTASSAFGAIAAVNGTLLLQVVVGADQGRIYRTAGSPNSLALVADIPDTESIEIPRCFTTSGATLFFTTGNGATFDDSLWATDGTSAGTRQVTTAVSVSSAMIQGPNCQMVPDGRGGIVFGGYTPTAGVEPWQSDGTSAGTRQLADIAPGGASSAPLRFARVGSQVFTAADDQVTGYELWLIETRWNAFLPSIVR